MYGQHEAIRSSENGVSMFNNGGKMMQKVMEEDNTHKMLLMKIVGEEFNKISPVWTDSDKRTLEGGKKIRKLAASLNQVVLSVLVIICSLCT